MTQAENTTAAAARPPETHFQCAPLAPTWVIIALGALFWLAVRRAYSRTQREIPPRTRRALSLLRVGALALLLLCLARPVMVRTGQLEEKGLGFIALDNSASMLFHDMPGGQTRWEAARAIFSAQRRRLDELATGLELQRYVFAQAPRPVPRLPGEENAPPLLPDGTGTDLAAVLEHIAAEAAGVSTAGAILISDGRHNAAKDVLPAAMALKRAGVPLYAIGLGQETTPADYKDVRIKQLVVPEKAFVGGRMNVGVEAESTLLLPEATELAVEVDGKNIYRQKIEFAAGVNVPHPPIQIPYTPDKLGVHRVTATLAPLPKETNLANNTATAFFRVFHNKIGVWYVEGAIRKEFGALRTALDTAPNLKLTAINAFAAQSSAAHELLPARSDEWAQTRLVIIGDLPATRFEYYDMAALAKFVENGGGVLMLGGLSTFGAGGWQDSPLAPVLPVEMSAEDGLQEGPLAITVAPGAREHFVLKLAEDAERSKELWNSLPPLPGVNTFSKLRPMAQVLLRAGERELLVVQDYGKGRSAVFAADMTWQWILKANLPEVHKTFWRNLATWLTHSDYRDADRTVFADSDSLHYQVGDEAVFGAHVYEIEKSAQRVKDARVVAALSRLTPQGEAPVFTEDVGRGAGDYTRRFALGAAGSYRFKASVIDSAGALIESDSLDLHVVAPDVENDNPRANLKLLQYLAAASGGRYFNAYEAGQAFDYLASRPAGYLKTITEVSELWSNWLVLLAFIGVLCAEWGLRKKWGLI